MQEQLEALALRLEELEAQLAQPETYADPKRLADLTRERKRLEPIVARHRAWVAAGHDLAGLEPLLADPEWVNKLRNGQAAQIHRCVRCNKKCLGGLMAHQGTRCIYDSLAQKKN